MPDPNAPDRIAVYHDGAFNDDGPTWQFGGWWEPISPDNPPGFVEFRLEGGVPSEARAVEWLLEGDTGISSKAILAVMLGIGVCRDSPPRDPADLGRCLRLLERFPEWKRRMHLMAGVGKNWAKAAECWDEISQSMTDEAGIDWSKGRSAPRTHGLMRERGL